MIPFGNISTHTAPRAVLPFYVYAALSLCAGALLLLFSAQAFSVHYFHPQLLAITHIMALGWGTMMIMGAAHQLLPVLSGNPLYSNKLAITSFLLTGAGVPLLSCAFYTFQMGDPAKWGGRLVLLGILAFLINGGQTVFRQSKQNVHVVFVYTAMVWLFFTAFFGLVLVYNFTTDLLPENAVHYLPLHAHAGIVGWFVMLVMGVASRLLPMFLVSKYRNDQVLWWIYGLLNSAMVLYVVLFYTASAPQVNSIPALLFYVAVVLFLWYCAGVYRARLRRHADLQMRYALLSVIMMLLPALLLLLLIAMAGFSGDLPVQYAVLYGFVIFFGWITLLIMAMTFKTLPFIIWHMRYSTLAGTPGIPDPRALVHTNWLRVMFIAYVSGFLCCVAGILISLPLLLQIGGVAISLAAILFLFHVIRIILHRTSYADTNQCT